MSARELRRGGSRSPRTLADKAAAGLARLEAERRARRAPRQDHALVRAARALNASLELGEVLRTLAREACLALDGDITGVYLGNAETGGVATAGHNLARRVARAHARRRRGRRGPGARHRAARSSPTTTTARRACPRTRRCARSAPRSPCRWPGTTSSRARSRSAGRSCAASTPRTCARCEAIADLATVACCNAETYEEIQHAARTDALTGLLNHGAMQVRLREEIARARARRHAAELRDPRPRRLQARQRLARPPGRRRAAARASPTCCATSCAPTTRSPATAATSSCCCSPAATRPTACARRPARARRGRRPGGAAARELELAGACSLGVAQWREPLDAEALLEHADRALMLAKRTGKGRVAVANADVERELALVRAERGSPAAVQALAAAIEERDDYTRAHSEQVVHLARGVAMILGLPAEERRPDRRRRAAARRRQARRARRDPAQARPADRRRMGGDGRAPGRRRAHPAADPRAGAIAPIVRHEHEHWDGSGYPDRLNGRAIPIGSRIILACDAYEAMITPRPYREAMSARRRWPSCAAARGVRFDPEVIDALLDLLGERRPRFPTARAAARMPAAGAAEPERGRRP